jgi:hypothetical protein
MTRAGLTLGLGLALALVGCASWGSPRRVKARPEAVVDRGSITAKAGRKSIGSRIDAYRTNRHTLAISHTGQMIVRLTWKDPAVDLELHLTAPSCSALYPMRTCPIAAAARGAVGAVEEVTRRVTAGERYSLFVDNLDPKRGQTYVLTVEIP